MKRFGFHVAIVTVGVLLGWLTATLSGGRPSSAAQDPKAVVRQPAAPNNDSTHYSAAPEPTVTLTESTKADAVEETRRQLVPSPQETPWLKPVLMGIGALALGAVVIGVAARRMGITDPGVAALEQDQKDAEFDEKHDEQPLDAPADPHSKSAHH